MHLARLGTKAKTVEEEDKLDPLEVNRFKQGVSFEGSQERTLIT